MARFLSALAVSVVAFACAKRADDTPATPAPRPPPDAARSAWQVAARPHTLSVGTHFACAIGAGARAYCWGFDALANEHGELGRGLETQASRRMLPAPVDGLDDVTAIDGGDDYTCALRAAGTIACWGHNKDKTLGDRTAEDRPVPVDVYPPWLIAHVKSVAAGARHACALLDRSEIACWGNVYSTEYSHSPPGAIGVPYFGDVVEIAPAGRRAWTCARLAGGTVGCWDPLADHNRARGAATGHIAIQAVPGVVDAVALAPGCALTKSGRIACWEVPSLTYDFGAKLTPPPRTVSTMPDAIAIVARRTGGLDAGCALRRAGTIRCWERDEASFSAFDVAGTDDASEVEVGSETLCVRRGARGIACVAWGEARRGATPASVEDL